MERTMTKYFPVSNEDSEPSFIHVARNGTDLGKIKVTEARAWLSSGELTRTDLYFDREMQRWLTLDCYPDLADLAV